MRGHGRASRITAPTQHSPAQEPSALARGRVHRRFTLAASAYQYGVMSASDIRDLRLGLTAELVDATAYGNAVTRFTERRIALPTFAQLADPSTAPAEALASVKGVDPDAADAANLWRVNWYNAADRTSRAEVPEHVVKLSVADVNGSLKKYIDLSKMSMFKAGDFDKVKKP